MTLGDVNCFPETNVFYLDLVQGDHEVHRLHDVLNSGVLKHQERFEFRPHLTIGGPVTGSAVEATQDHLSKSWLARSGHPGFQVSEVAALWFDPANGTPDWTRVWTQRFGASESFRASTASGDSA